MAKGHKYNITNLLGLEGLKVLEVVEEEEGFIVIEVQAKKRKAFCPHCGSKHLYKHGHARPRRVLHAFICGKRVYLKIQGLQRWKCRICGRTFTQRLEILRPKSTRPCKTKEGATCFYLWQEGISKDTGTAEVEVCQRRL